ncbi:MAG: hypothetical protein AAF449_16405 [Myxococcota bacterium]
MASASDASSPTGAPSSDSSAAASPSFYRITDGRVWITPPSDAQLTWILEQLGRPEIARALGWERSIGSEIYSGYIEETVLLLPFGRFGRDEASAVGFVMLMRPDLSFRKWTVNVAVPRPGHRDGFTALAALDAMCHLVFDLRGDEGLEWLIEPSNRASMALPKRLGYAVLERVEREGTTYDRFAIGREQWQARQARASRRRPLAYDVAPVPLEAVAHSAIMRAVRGWPKPSGSSSPTLWRRIKGLRRFLRRGR